MIGLISVFSEGRSLMGLFVELKRGEQLFLGECSVACEVEKVKLHVRGRVPLLRESDTITAKQADTPAKRLCLLLQQIYLSRKATELHELYVLFADDVVRAMPEAETQVARIDDLVAAGEHFKALKAARALVDREIKLGAEPAGCPDEGVSRIGRA
jgi:flagellar protein FlbT